MSIVNPWNLHWWKEHNCSFLIFCLCVFHLSGMSYYFPWPNQLLCFFQSSFFTTSLAHLPLIPLLLPSRYSSISVCGVLICTFGICCFVIGGQKSFLTCIISLLNQSASSFQKEIVLCVCSSFCIHQETWLGLSVHVLSPQ